MIDFSLVLSWLFQAGVAFLATITFSIIFHTPRREWLCCGITGGLGWLVYLICMSANMGVVASSFFATLALAWIARVFAFFRKAPVTVFLITGIFPLVPGAGIYYTGYHVFMSDNAQALAKGMETIKIAVAIALGIGIVLSLPAFFFTFRRSGSKSGKRP
ncbi:MAG: threonine/serine exporter family protein [Acutalibacter sp.]